jgi:hypothetical protein
MTTVLANNGGITAPATQYLANFAAARDPAQIAAVNPAAITDGSTGTPVSPSDTLYYSSTAGAAVFLTRQ